MNIDTCNDNYAKRKELGKNKSELYDSNSRKTYTYSIVTESKSLVTWKWGKG